MSVARVPAECWGTPPWCAGAPRKVCWLHRDSRAMGPAISGDTNHWCHRVPARLVGSPHFRGGHGTCTETSPRSFCSQATRSAHSEETCGGYWAVMGTPETGTGTRALHQVSVLAVTKLLLPRGVPLQQSWKQSYDGTRRGAGDWDSLVGPGSAMGSCQWWGQNWGGLKNLEVGPGTSEGPGPITQP